MKNNQSKKKIIVIIAITLFWIITTGWLVMTEIIPGAFSRVSQGYRSMLSGGVVVSDSWMQIFLDGHKIGYSHSSVESDEENAVQKYNIYNNTELTIPIMSKKQSISVTAKSSLDAMYHLQDFSFDMQLADYKIYVTGQRMHGDSFDVRIKNGDSYKLVRVNIPDDAIIYSPMAELALKSLKPGRQKRIRTFNPLSMSTEDIMIKALRYEDITNMNKTYRATVLSADYQGVKVLTWIDNNGNVLRQETPFGWALESCDAETAMTASDSNIGEYDLMNSQRSRFALGFIWKMYREWNRSGQPATLDANQTNRTEISNNQGEL